MGMECSIKLTVKLNSGRLLVNECVCLWCKRWDIADLVCDIVGVKNDYEYHMFKLKNGELKRVAGGFCGNDLECLTFCKGDSTPYGL